jgi:hypothetical protein
MNVAIIICGHLRSWDKTKKTFIQTFSKYKPHIFVNTYDNKWEHFPGNFSNQSVFTNHYKDEILNEQNIRYLFDDLDGIKKINIENLTEVSKEVNSENLSPGMADILNTHRFYFPFRKIDLSIKDIIDYENQNNLKYDYIIKVRPDLKFAENISFEIEDDEVLTNFRPFNGNSHLIDDVAYMMVRNKFIDVNNFIINQFHKSDTYYNPNEQPHNIIEHSFKINNLSIVRKHLVEDLIDFPKYWNYDENN